VISSLHPDHRSDALIGRVQDMSERLGGDVLARQSQIHRDGDTQQLGEIVAPRRLSLLLRMNCAALPKARRCTPGSWARR
jgi:hypothetical protein